MTGLWMILLLAFTQPDELLPAPKNELLPKPLMVSSNMEPQQVPLVAPECKIGWGTDPVDQSMYMVIQLAPESIAQFAAGGRSMELESLIPKGLQGRVQKVIVRVGSGPVEQSPPESELERLPALNNSTSSSMTNSPLISNLDRRSPVSIDSPRSADRTASEIVPTSGTTQLPVVPGLNLPAVPNPVLPSGPTVVSTPIPNQTVPNGAPLAGASTASGSSAYSAPASSAYGSDGFAPMPRTVPSTLNPFGKSGLANTTTTTSQGNVTYSSSATSPQQGVYPNNGSYNSVPHLASNPNAPQGGYVLPTDNYASYGQPQGGYVQNGYAQNGYGHGGYANQVAHNPLPSNPVLPIQQAGSRPLPSTVSPPVLTLPSTQQRELELASTSPRGSLVPFFLVLSFILNVYFGLWLNHLSTKYRHLLGSVRGLTPTTLEG
jgi:hypothetical protein